MTQYADRPWLRQYADWMPADLEPDFDNMLTLFKASVHRSPDAVVIKYFDGQLTFADLDRHSDALAAALLERGFESGDRLALFVQNDPSFVVGLLGAWKAGGCAVAVTPMYKARELSHLLNDSGAVALLCLDDLFRTVARDVVATGETPVTTVITASGRDWQTRNDSRLFSGPAEPLTSEGVLPLSQVVANYAGAELAPLTPAGDTVAVITYTSGTTGEPKGAMNTHANIAFNSQTYRDWVRITSDDAIYGVAPLFHITGLVAHIGLAFLVGSPLILNYRFEPGVVIDAIREHRPTFTVGSITVFINLVDNPDMTRADWACFRALYSGGAAIAPAVAADFKAKTGLSIHTVYGLTETTSPSHAVPLGMEPPIDPISGARAVGIPTFNTACRILDDRGSEVAVGITGEIAIAGPQVVPGYWRKPEATAQSLPGGELLSGDVGFMDEQGWFYVVERKKDMINAAGFKVWPREVEDVLYSHPQVREAAVVGVPDKYRGETVVAYVCTKRGTDVTDTELIEFCRERMAAYKYPRNVYFLDELPKTISGKILRRELRAGTA